MNTSQVSDYPFFGALLGGPFIFLVKLLVDTGVDGAVLKDIRDNANFDKLLSFPELSEFIDQDPYISELMRAPKEQG